MATKKTPQKMTPTPVVTPTVSAAAAAPVLANKKAATKKVAAKKTAKPVVKAINGAQFHHEIRTEAYNYFIQRGYRPGDPVADWHRAENAVLRRHGLR